MTEETKETLWFLAYPVLLVFCLLFIVLKLFSLNERVEDIERTNNLVDIEIRLEQPEFLLKGPKEGLMEALEYYNISNPEIVYSMAYLETGNFKSGNCVKGNNCFGLYDSRNKRYMTFNHWIDGVVLFKRLFSDTYTDTTQNYYDFIVSKNYCSDPNYVTKVKQIRKQLFKHD